MDAKNENIVIYTSIIFQAIYFLVIAFSHSAWMLLIGGALLGLGYGNITSTSQSVSVKVVPKKNCASNLNTLYRFRFRLRIWALYTRFVY